VVRAPAQEKDGMLRYVTEEVDRVKGLFQVMLHGDASATQP
jgi:hypothetical protein